MEKLTPIEEDQLKMFRKKYEESLFPIEEQSVNYKRLTKIVLTDKKFTHKCVCYNKNLKLEFIDTNLSDEFSHFELEEIDHANEI